jgi:hypothetical protein
MPRLTPTRSPSNGAPLCSKQSAWALPFREKCYGLCPFVRSVMGSALSREVLWCCGLIAC